MVMFFISPVQPLMGSTMMGLAAIVPILLGPNPLRVLGLMAFVLAGYFFWPEFQESKKVPTRLAVREALQLNEPLKAAVAAYVAKEKRLPAEGELALKLPENDKVAIEAQSAGGFRLRLKFAPLEGRSLNQTPTLTGDKLTWQCVSEDIEQSYLPRQCRNAENLRKAAAAAAKNDRVPATKLPGK
jgi:hypothetical protein